MTRDQPRKRSARCTVCQAEIKEAERPDQLCDGCREESWRACDWCAAPLKALEPGTARHAGALLHDVCLTEILDLVLLDVGEQA